MPLLPHVRDVLHQLTALTPPLETLTPAQARLRPRLTVQPAPVAQVENRLIPGPDGPLPVRIYWPLGAAGSPLPLLVYLHGGGWVLSDVDAYDDTCRDLANGGGCIVISVEYRLAPEHPFPAPVEDAWAATCWAAEQATLLGGDPARVAVGGDSAGANLAAVVALLARDQGAPRLALQMLVYPVTSADPDTPSALENASGYLLTRAAMGWFFGHYVRTPADAADWRVAPLLAPDLAGLPPALVTTAEFDPLRSDGEAYAARLQAAGVPVQYTCWQGNVHGCFANPLLDPTGSYRAEVAAFLRAGFDRP